MSQNSIIDTFPAFLEFWDKVQNAPLDAQVELWASDYMGQWTELLEKQVEDYASQQIEWKQLASEKIFPYLGARLPAMKDAHQNIISLYSSLLHQAHQKIGLEIDVTCVLYVGIGCGAGWVTTYQNKPAILFGLENIAECGWSDSNSIAGLIAHELGHVFHNVLRTQLGAPDDSGEWWQLFSEGFAQRCEHLILGRETWHEAIQTKTDWIAWCYNNRSYLASEFLRYVAEGKDIRSFFGSWYNIDGYSQSGYFLGHEVVKQLEASGMSIMEIGLLEQPEIRLREILEHFAKTERT